MPARVVGWVIGVVCWAAAISVAAQQDTRPNILLIVAEDLSPRIGSFGDLVAKTPSIDSLAEQGIRYTNVFTASGVCAPSRSALITGVHLTSTGHASDADLESGL